MANCFVFFFPFGHLLILAACLLTLCQLKVSVTTDDRASSQNGFPDIVRTTGFLRLTVSGHVTGS